MNQEPKVCSICGEGYFGYGNNAFPVNTGRCCNTCNALVTQHRINNFRRGLAPYAYPEWFNQELLEEVQLFLEKKRQKRKEGSIRENNRDESQDVSQTA